MRKRLPKLFRTTTIAVAGLLAAPAPVSAVEMNPEFSDADDHLKVRRAFDALDHSKARHAFNAISPAERKKLLAPLTGRNMVKSPRFSVQGAEDHCISVNDYSENSVGFRIGVSPDGMKFNGGVPRKSNDGAAFGSSTQAMRRGSAFCAPVPARSASMNQPDPVESLGNRRSTRALPPFSGSYSPASELGESLRRQRYTSSQTPRLAPLPSMPLTTDTYREGRSSRTPKLPGRVIVTTPGGGLKTKMQ